MGEPTPVLALAVHAGHEIRDELVLRMAVSEDLRLYEEDPLTDRFARKFPIAAWATASRFEVDLNREEEKAVYMTPDMAWGIHVWNDPPTPEMKKRSLDRWHEGQRFVDGLVDRAVEQFGYCILLDFHSYNYQRDKEVPDWWAEEKPAINLGTREAHPRFRKVLDAILEAFGRIEWDGRPVTVRENFPFKGGYVHRRQQARHPDRVLVPSIEMKKIFMNEREGGFLEPGFPKLLDDTVIAVCGVMERLHELLPDLTGRIPLEWR